MSVIVSAQFHGTVGGPEPIVVEDSVFVSNEAGRLGGKCSSSLCVLKEASKKLRAQAPSLPLKAPAAFWAKVAGRAPAGQGLILVSVAFSSKAPPSVLPSQGAALVMRCLCPIVSL